MGLEDHRSRLAHRSTSPGLYFRIACRLQIRLVYRTIATIRTVIPTRAHATLLHRPCRSLLAYRQQLREKSHPVGPRKSAETAIDLSLFRLTSGIECRINDRSTRHRQLEFISVKRPPFRILVFLVAHFSEKCFTIGFCFLSFYLSTRLFFVPVRYNIYI